MKMSHYPDISSAAKLIADPSRAVILQSLMSVDGLPASELAHKAGISVQTASSHLSKLIEGNLLTVERHGRHKYYRLANSKVAEIIESLSIIAPEPKVHSFNSYNTVHKLKKARSCYDHLAGLLGVSITEAFINNRYLEDHPNEKEYKVTEAGVLFFNGWGIDVEHLRTLNRYFAKKCLDWSERKYHLAGSLGNEVMKYMIKALWIEKKSNREISITELGIKKLKTELGVIISEE
ncbi:putative transcriptional regulator [Bacillus sp. TS-2]|nr:putative transcriptional regulator [Bacillus sp. TS-2]